MICTLQLVVKVLAIAENQLRTHEAIHDEKLSTLMLELIFVSLFSFKQTRLILFDQTEANNFTDSINFQSKIVQHTFHKLTHICDLCNSILIQLFWMQKSVEWSNEIQIITHLPQIMMIKTNRQSHVLCIDIHWFILRKAEEIYSGKFYVYSHRGVGTLHAIK